MHKNPFLEIMEKAEQACPNLKIQLDSPQNETGPWFLDLQVDEYLLTVEYYNNLYSVVADREVCYGERGDEFFDKEDEAAVRIAQLILERKPTVEAA
jgi:hypothetical protein